MTVRGAVKPRYASRHARHALAEPAAVRVRRMHFDLGDVPTWLAVVAAAVAAAIALRQLRSQQDVIRRQTEQLERKQASRVEVRLAATTVLGLGFSTWSVEVRNGSRGPIRWLSCEILTASGVPEMPAQIAKVIYGASGTPEPREQRGLAFFILRPGTTVVFAFRKAVEEGQAEESDEEIPVPFVVRFKDDADLPWEVDQSLYLRRGVTQKRR